MSARDLSYAGALREGFATLLRDDERVFLIGQGLWSPWYVGASMTDLDKEFGRDRVLDSPTSENATTGAALGAALAGMRPIVIHPRMDFMLLAVDQLVNQAANWFFMSGGRVPAPVVVRAIVNRGGEQAAQHSQSVHAWFMHVPGLRVVMPSDPHDAKGLLIASVEDPNPVLFIDDRWLYDDVGPVPEQRYTVPLGKAAIRREGRDVTIVGNSYMAREAVAAAVELDALGIDAEVIDLRCLRPLDSDTILASVAKTGRLVVADGGWVTAGVGAEIAAIVAGEGFHSLRGPIARVGLPDLPAPMASTLEKAYYRTRSDIVRAAEKVVRA